MVRAAPREGFSLLEILVALAVFGLAAMALLNLSGESVRTAARVQDRTLGGIVADLEATMSGFSGGIAGGAAVVGLVGLNRSYPEADVAQYLNESGRGMLAASQADCLLDAAIAYPFLDAAALEAWPGSITNNTELSKVVRMASPLFRPGVPAVPVLLHHAVADEFAPIGSARASPSRRRTPAKSKSSSTRRCSPSRCAGKSRAPSSSAR